VAVLLSLAALLLAYLMLRNTIAWLFVDPRVIIAPRVALSNLAVVAMVVVAPIATNVHWRTAARAGSWVTLGGALLGEPPADPKRFRAWWWGRLAATAWIVGFVAIAILVAW
jgi:hypothetical protein